MRDLLRGKRRRSAARVHVTPPELELFSRREPLEVVEVNARSASVFGLDAHYFVEVVDVAKVAEWRVFSFPDLNGDVRYGVTRRPNGGVWSHAEFWISERHSAVLAAVNRAGPVLWKSPMLIWDDVAYVAQPQPTITRASALWKRASALLADCATCWQVKYDRLVIDVGVDGEQRGAVVLVDIPSCGVGLLALAPSPLDGLYPDLVPAEYCAVAPEPNEALTVFLTVADGLGRRSNTVRVLVPALPRADANPSSTAPSAPRPR